MHIMSKNEGVLKIDVASRGDYIKTGNFVTVFEMQDNLGRLSVRVDSVNSTVFLNYYDTDISQLIDLK